MLIAIRIKEKGTKSPDPNKTMSACVAVIVVRTAIYLRISVTTGLSILWGDFSSYQEKRKTEILPYPCTVLTLLIFYTPKQI